MGEDVDFFQRPAETLNAEMPKTCSTSANSFAAPPSPGIRTIRPFFQSAAQRSRVCGSTAIARDSNGAGVGDPTLRAAVSTAEIVQVAVSTTPIVPSLAVKKDAAYRVAGAVDRIVPAAESMKRIPFWRTAASTVAPSRLIATPSTRA